MWQKKLKECDKEAKNEVRVITDERNINKTIIDNINKDG